MRNLVIPPYVKVDSPKGSILLKKYRTNAQQVHDIALQARVWRYPAEAGIYKVLGYTYRAVLIVDAAQTDLVAVPWLKIIEYLGRVPKGTCDEFYNREDNYATYSERH